MSAAHYSGGVLYLWRCCDQSTRSLACLAPLRVLGLQQKCVLKHPPGDEIYRDKGLSMFEVGEANGGGGGEGGGVGVKWRKRGCVCQQEGRGGEWVSVGARVDAS